MKFKLLSSTQYSGSKESEEEYEYWLDIRKKEYKMKYKIGDKVKVREDLEVGKEYGNQYFIDLMEEYKGQIVTVISVKTAHYEIEEDDRSFAWTDEMLEPIEREKNNMNIEELNLEYKNKMDKLLEEYKAKVKEVIKKEEPFIEIGQDYYFIDSTVNVCISDWTNHLTDKKRLLCGNMFPFTAENKEEIEKEVNLIAEKRKLQSQMEMFARQNNEGKIDWNDNNQKKWYFYINYIRSEITIAWYAAYRTPNVTYFTSREVAEKALEKFGDRIRELYIDVENNLKDSEQQGK